MRQDGSWEVADTASVVRRVRSLRDAEDGPFEVVVPGESEPVDTGRRNRFADHEQAGATWWVEAVHPWRYGYEEAGEWPLGAMEERLQAGP
jgi:hypothetical protein